MTGPDGRCKAFDAGANGFGRGEGCGVVMVKRLEDAIAHGDNILSVVCSMFSCFCFLYLNL
jgi:acyl transferase domain-containing protein